MLRNFVRGMSSSKNGSDPLSATFFQPSVQACLQRLTGLDYSKVFRVARKGQDVSAPTYVFMTDRELAQAQAETLRKARRKLHMPPVMSERSTKPEVLEQDLAIQGYDSARYMFTDITYGVHDRDRIIVARESDGTLREAMGEERDRLNQIYFPRKGRKVKMPLLFEPEHLNEILGPERYEYVLDRNCVQFEPDHPVYIRTARAVYDHINDNGNYAILKSTRHYGPMVFYLVWERICDNLMVHYFHHQELDNAVEVVKLYGMLNEKSKVGRLEKDVTEMDQDEMLATIRSYIQNESKKETKLHVALESMLEVQENNRKTNQDLIKSS